jgi:RNA polymerase sigma factor (sigma-70 family)
MLNTDRSPRVRPSTPTEIIREAFPVLRATARRLVPAGEVEDLVQEAVIETLVHHPGFEGIERPVGYLATVLFRRAFARHRRWIEIPLDLQEHLEARPDAVDDRLMTEAALATLGRRQRACVVLRYLHGMDDRAIAEILGCGTSTVRSQTARALARLRVEMEADDDHA